MLPKNASLNLALSLVLALSAAQQALAQSSEPPERPKRTQDPDAYYKAPGSMHGKIIVLPIGTTFAGRVDHTISSEHSRQGERFNVVVDSPVLINGSDVVIPQGSQVVGEVVEAVPAAAVPRQPWEKKPLIHGKLRVEFSSLRTPDGATYPLVAAIAGEVSDPRYRYLDQYKAPLGTSVGYVGTQAGFAASDVNRIQAEIQRKYRGQLGPEVMHKKDFLKDEVAGFGPDIRGYDGSHPRSLVLKKRDLYIFKGSPLTIKVMAPFRIGMIDPGQGVPVGSLGDEPRERELPPPSMPPEQSAQPSPPLSAASPAGTARGGTGAPMPNPGGAAIPPDSF